MYFDVRHCAHAESRIGIVSSYGRLRSHASRMPTALQSARLRTMALWE